MVMRNLFITPLTIKDAYIGINKVICSEMMIYWGEKKVDKIQFFTQPKGNMIPLKKVQNFEEYKIPGFNWTPSRQPKSVEDILKPKVILPTSITPIGKKEQKPNKETIKDKKKQ